MVGAVQGVIYDVDGTLLNSRLAQYEWLRFAASLYDGLDPFPKNDADFWDGYNQAYATQGMQGLYSYIGVDFQVRSGEIWEKYNQYNQSHPVPMIDGVEEVLKDIFARGRVGRARSTCLRLGLNTTKSWKDIERPLAHVMHCFDSVVTKDDIYNYVTDGEARRKHIPFDDYSALRKLLPEEVVKQLEKPNSLASMLSLARLGICAENAIAFEDTCVGIKSMQNVLMPHRRASVYTVAVTWGYESRAELAEAKPDEIIDTPAQMIELLEDLKAI